MNLPRESLFLLLLEWAIDRADFPQKCCRCAQSFLICHPRGGHMCNPACIPIGIRKMGPCHRSGAVQLSEMLHGNVCWYYLYIVDLDSASLCESP